MADKLFTISDAGPGTAKETPVELSGGVEILMNGVELIGTKSNLTHIEAHTLDSTTITVDETFDAILTNANSVVVKGHGIGSVQHALIQDIKPVGTDGGSFVPGQWRGRDLTDIVYNSIPGLELNSHLVLLPPGLYTLQAVCPAFNVRGNQSRLHNNTLDETIAYSTTAYSRYDLGTKTVVVAPYVSYHWFYLRVQHRCEVTNSGDGFGKAVGKHNEQYSEVLISKYN